MWTAQFIAGEDTNTLLHQLAHPLLINPYTTVTIKFQSILDAKTRKDENYSLHVAHRYH
jgi:hypothetical protein